MKSILKVTAGILLLTSCQKNIQETTLKNISKSNPTEETVVSARSSSEQDPIYDAGICIYSNGDIYIAEKTNRKIYKNNVNSLGAWVWVNRCTVPFYDYDARGIDIATTYKKDNNGVTVNDLPIMIGNDPYEYWRLNSNNFWYGFGFYINHFKRLASEPSSDPAVDAKVWMISIYDNSIRYHNYSGNNWIYPGGGDKYPGNGEGVDIDVYNSVPYIIGIDQKIYFGNGSGWTQLAGNGLGKRIATDRANGKIWIIGVDFKIYSFNSTTSTWVQYPGNGSGYDICAYNGIPYILASNNTVWKGTGTGWLQIR